MCDPFAEDPALVHFADVNGPATHVIAIGVGHYPHLTGGGASLSRYHLGMKQVSSPPLSARLVADWFIREFDCSECPLGSVSLLLSEPQPKSFTNTQSHAAYQVPRADTPQIEAALKAWSKRAETHDKSRLILYFCGHGLAEGSQNLFLFSDYGEDDDNPLKGALNYDSFMSGLATRKASLQFLLFDACRTSATIATLNRNGGQYFFSADNERRFGIEEEMQQCPIFSTELDREALGRPGEPTLCAKAFIRVMRGACCKEDGDYWYITTHQVREALTDFQRLEAGNSGITQRADANRYAFIHLRRLPPASRGFQCSCASTTKP